MQRRRFIQYSSLLGMNSAFLTSLPAWAQTGSSLISASNSVLNGSWFDLTINQTRTTVANKKTQSILVNNQLPAPLLRWKEGDEITIKVNNALEESTSIHWHGVLLPFQMDGVPGVSFPGIKKGESFVYEFPLKQSGTYWYHSHSNLQEQLGLYGPIIIDPKDSDPVDYDREYIVMLSDWTFEDPHRVFSKLKKMSDTYNFSQRTVGDFFHDVAENGIEPTLADRMMWGGMRMNPTDIADISGANYTYLLNGHSPGENWSGLFEVGEKIRLRFINASAMSIFNVRIPDLPMTIVQADGLNVQPVEIDEFQIGTAETFDVLINPTEHIAHTIMCETNDRSAYASGTLTPQEGLLAEAPPLRPKILLTMKDMGMNDMEMADMDMPKSNMGSSGLDHMEMSHSEVSPNSMPAMQETGVMKEGIKESTAMASHEHLTGVGVVNTAMSPSNRLAEKPLGLEEESHRVLVYTDLKSLEVNPDTRNPERELELHLTSNMERYMWSFDGVKFSEVKGSIEFKEGERLRLIMVNDTMMPHPIHLHGMFFDVVTGGHKNKPRKHTIVVKPGEEMAVDITADAIGDWAFHCHLLYHMHAGMMRVVSVRAGAS